MPCHTEAATPLKPKVTAATTVMMVEEAPSQIPKKISEDQQQLVSKYY
jgi:hypothetical protein